MSPDYICSLSEYVGTAAACTIGMVIATVDPAIKILLMPVMYVALKL